MWFFGKSKEKKEEIFILSKIDIDKMLDEERKQAFDCFMNAISEVENYYDDMYKSRVKSIDGIINSNENITRKETLRDVVKKIQESF